MIGKIELPSISESNLDTAAAVQGLLTLDSAVVYNGSKYRCVVQLFVPDGKGGGTPFKIDPANLSPDLYAKVQKTFLAVLKAGMSSTPNRASLEGIQGFCAKDGAVVFSGTETEANRGSQGASQAKLKTGDRGATAEQEMTALLKELSRRTQKASAPIVKPAPTKQDSSTQAPKKEPKSKPKQTFSISEPASPLTATQSSSSAQATATPKPQTASTAAHLKAKTAKHLTAAPPSPTAKKGAVNPKSQASSATEHSKTEPAKPSRKATSKAAVAPNQKKSLIDPQVLKVFDHATAGWDEPLMKDFTLTQLASLGNTQVNEDIRRAFFHLNQYSDLNGIKNPTHRQHAEELKRWLVFLCRDGALYLESVSTNKKLGKQKFTQASWLYLKSQLVKFRPKIKIEEQLQKTVVADSLKE